MIVHMILLHIFHSFFYYCDGSCRLLEKQWFINFAVRITTFLSCDKKIASNNLFLADGGVSGRSLLNFVK